MSDNKDQVSNEQVSNQDLSDLMDGMVSDEAFESILADEKQGEAWFRYHTARAVMQGEGSAFSSFDFTRSVAEKLAMEAEHAVASDEVIDAQPKEAEVIELGRWQPWRKLGGGLAVAASVAFAMVFSVQMMNKAPSVELQPGTTIASGVEGQILPEVELTTDDKLQQRQLDDIQQILNRSRNNFRVNEQFVSGNEAFVQSFIVETKEKDDVSEFQREIRNMKKPSEMENSPEEDKKN
ncbi:MAG: RseA family anti-sigma factor [Kangiellaceae bacterium]|nr:RseA family anti-sigma factor [Kangiellaceae bacterium]MCW8997726.1 RseA family anti-sigma factor [Kangiellaceae bacterium]MCW9018230.1 RseA family anti-sigma factor [Kangiellaceae bacterium]